MTKDIHNESVKAIMSMMDAYHKSLSRSIPKYKANTIEFMVENVEKKYDEGAFKAAYCDALATRAYILNC